MIEHESILIVAAHPDDEVLGCGGSMARWTREGRAVHVLIAAEGATSRGVERNRAAHAGELSALARSARAAGDLLGIASLTLLDFPDNRLDGVERLELVKQVEAAVGRHRPSLVLTHHGGDVNIDHRVLQDAVVAACRPQPGHPVRELLFFEVPSSTEWRPPGSYPGFSPNCFVDIAATLDLKLQALSAYVEELRSFPHPRSPEAVTALARWRGASAGLQAAEAFVVGRIFK